MTGKLEPCILPWINFCTTPSGRARPCGYSKFKSDTKIKNSTVAEEFNNEIYKKVRLDFLQGQWPENCSRCQYMEEAQPGKSKKASEKPFFDEYRHLLQNTKPDGSVDQFPKQIDIRLGTICNLKCIHCGTGNSSKWSEDKSLIGKYQNTEDMKHDNSWVDRDSDLWENIHLNLGEVTKFNFLGGEPFASRQHGRLIERIVETPYKDQIILHYVSNGLLLTDKMIANLKKFKQVTLNISLDASGEVLEFFRYPTNSGKLHEKLQTLDREASTHFNPALQWTSSNISLYYLDQTLDYFERNFRNLEFKFCNFVDFPFHMSPQNLPLPIKKEIETKLKSYVSKYSEIQFYLDHMNERNAWAQGEETFINYLDDLSEARGLNWKNSFQEFHQALEKAKAPDPEAFALNQI